MYFTGNRGEFHVSYVAQATLVSDEQVEAEIKLTIPTGRYRLLILLESIITVSLSQVFASRSEFEIAFAIKLCGCILPI